jgi:UDP-N-acetylmuramate--alanine ligase
MGAEVHLGHDAVFIDGADVVVVSSAIPVDNPESAAARAAGATVMTRGEALAALLEGSRSIVVAGTHGRAWIRRSWSAVD